jgi:hypothetical protein
MGHPDDLQRLAGTWSGEYHGDVGGSGSIVFQLEAGRDTAYGDVLMMPREGHESVQTHRPDVVRLAYPAPQLLNIAFVRIAEGYVVGTIATYVDPETGDAWTARFEGNLRDRTIEGRYVATAVDQRESREGWWKVVRSEKRESNVP